MHENALHLPPGVADPFNTAPATMALPTLKRPCDAFSRKTPPYRLGIYPDQYYTPETDGCCGRADRSGHADELEPYRAELARLDVEIEDDPDADHLPEIDHEDDSTPWLE